MTIKAKPQCFREMRAFLLRGSCSLQDFQDVLCSWTLLLLAARVESEGLESWITQETWAPQGGKALPVLPVLPVTLCPPHLLLCHLLLSKEEGLGVTPRGGKRWTERFWWRGPDGISPRKGCGSRCDCGECLCVCVSMGFFSGRQPDTDKGESEGKVESVVQMIMSSKWRLLNLTAIIWIWNVPQGP
jgi:hypothetical protein